ncbi:MAG: hypothetical protein ABFD02_18035, partial [Bacteroidales bacterium]
FSNSCVLELSFVEQLIKNMARITIVLIIGLFLLFNKIAHNGWRYVYVADFGAPHCQAVMKFEASHSR